MRPIAIALTMLLLAACESGPTEQPAAQPRAAETTVGVPGDRAEIAPYAAITHDEVLRFTGTEPFWGGNVTGGTLTYSTPEDQDGTEIAVERFAGRGGLSFSGTLDGANFEMAVTELECSDGMSDRTYPFTVTLEIGEDRRNGCGWTERRRFEGPEHP